MKDAVIRKLQLECPDCGSLEQVKVDIAVEPVDGGAEPYFLSVRGGAPHDCPGARPSMAIDFAGPEGNTFVILAKASRLLSDADAAAMALRVTGGVGGHAGTGASSYQEALDIIEEYVRIVNREEAPGS